MFINSWEKLVEVSDTFAINSFVLSGDNTIKGKAISGVNFNGSFFYKEHTFKCTPKIVRSYFKNGKVNIGFN